MYLALPHRTVWHRRARPRVLARRRVRRRSLKTAEQRRYIWQAVLLLLLMLVACAVGLLLGVNYQD